MAKYTLDIPKNYEKRPFPFLTPLLKDLRENGDKQGTGALCRNGKYCCLGRLSLIQGRLIPLDSDNLKGYYQDSKSGRTALLAKNNPNFPFIRSDGSLPVSVVFDGQIAHRLATLNDRGFSFAEIADILEKLFYHIDV